MESVPIASFDYGGNPDLTVKEALGRAAAKIGSRFQDQPLVEAAIRLAIGDAYSSLHRNQSAVPHLERAVVLREKHLETGHPDTRTAMLHFSSALAGIGRHDEAIHWGKRLFENREDALGSDHPETLAALNDWASAYWLAGRYERSVPLLEQLLNKQRDICGPTHSQTIGTMHAPAMNYLEADRLDESIKLHEALLEALNNLGAGNELPSWPLRTFAQACQRAGRLDRADKLLREALATDRNAADSQRQRNGTANTLGWLALNLYLQERYDEAEPLVREAVALNQNERKRYFQWVSVLGAVLLAQKNYTEAEPLLLQGYEGTVKWETNSIGDAKRRLIEAGERVVHFYEVTNQPEKAREWREKISVRAEPKRPPEIKEVNPQLVPSPVPIDE